MLRFKPTLLRLTLAIVAMAMFVLPISSTPIVLTFSVVEPFSGCFNTISTLTTPQTGQLNLNTFGRGHFFVGLDPAGQNISLQFGINTAVTPNQIIGGLFQHDLEWLTTQGGQIFGKAAGTSSTDANGMITFQGTFLVFGGTKEYTGAKGAGSFNGTIFTKDFTDSRGVLHTAGTGTFCFSGNIRRSIFT